MRGVSTILLAGVLPLAACAGHGAPRLVQARTRGPVLDAIVQKTLQEGAFPVVITEFHFHDARGDVNYLHRELVSTDGPYTKVQGTPIDLPAGLEARGAVFAGRWPCGPNRYVVHMRAYFTDAQGVRSNVRPYVIHCNGG